MIALKTLAASILELLQSDPARYRSFGPYWPLVKHTMKCFYGPDNLALLGPHVVRDAAAHMPPHSSLEEAMAAAIEFYNNHQAYGMGGNQFVDEETGDTWMLADPDASGI